MMTSTTTLRIKDSLRIYEDIYEKSLYFSSNDDVLPVIDNWLDVNNDWVSSGIESFGKFRSLVKSELDSVKTLAKDYDPSDIHQGSNALAHLSVWKALINSDISPHPITAVNKYVPLPKVKGQKGKAKCIKIDIVADAGKKWIRISNLKMSTVLAELAELDSLLTSSEDEDDFNNNDIEYPIPTLLKLGNELSEASLNNPIHGKRPEVHLYLSRLQDLNNEKKIPDPRIKAQIQALESYGILIHFGIPEKHNDNVNAHRNPIKSLKPTIDINLDVSILIALISLTTHTNSPQELSLHPNLEYEHFRAISSQLQQEVNGHAFFDKILDNCKDNDIQFWTTNENKERCLGIIDKIGGESEKKRFETLFINDNDKYWNDSRFSKNYIKGLPVKVIYEGTGNNVEINQGSFQEYILRRCNNVLHSPQTESGSATKLTPHTLRTITTGIQKGFTTLTSNRGSIKALVLGWHTHTRSNNDYATFWLVEPRSLSEQILNRKLQIN